MKAEWERVFGEEYAPVHLRTMKGDDFVSAEYASDDKGKHRPDAAAFLIAYAKRLRDSGKPFFYFQHLPIKGMTGDSGGGRRRQRVPRAEDLPERDRLHGPHAPSVRGRALQEA